MKVKVNKVVENINFQIVFKKSVVNIVLNICLCYRKIKEN